MELEGATVVVTGGARGIGRGIVESFAAEGANIVIADLLEADGIAEAAEETAASATAAGVEAEIVATDVTHQDRCEALIARAIERFGRLDVVCANAGIITMAPVSELTLEQWNQTIDVNATGVFLTCKAAVDHFVEQRHGCFVNTASIAGKRGGANVSHYCASKFAVIGFTQSLALEMAPHNVRANAICPGFLGTHMWLDVILGHVREEGGDVEEAFDQVNRERMPLGRPQTPADIGLAAVYLAKADNVTGTAMTVAGGYEVN